MALSGTAALTFGYFMPLKIIDKLSKKLKIKVQSKRQNWNGKWEDSPNPIRAIIMLYICFWVFKIFEMSLDQSFFLRQNIKHTWQSIFTAMMPGQTYWFTVIPQHFNYKKRFFNKLIEHIMYVCIMISQIIYCRRFTLQQLHQSNEFFKVTMFTVFTTAWISLQSNSFVVCMCVCVYLSLCACVCVCVFVCLCVTL